MEDLKSGERVDVGVGAEGSLWKKGVWRACV